MTREDETGGTGDLSFEQVLGARLSQWRGLVGYSQQDLAAAARRHGLKWSHPTITEIEAGRRNLRAKEFLILPFLLNEAAQAMVPPLTFQVTLNDLLNPGTSGRLAISPELKLTGDQVREWLDNTLPPVEED